MINKLISILEDKKDMTILGVGSSRFVSKLDEDKVSKNAYNEFGCMQNKTEFDIFNKFGNDIPLNKIYDLSNDKSVIICDNSPSVMDVLCSNYNQKIDYKLKNVLPKYIDFIEKNFGLPTSLKFEDFEKYMIDLNVKIRAFLPSLKEVIESDSEISLDNIGLSKSSTGEVKLVMIDYGIINDKILDDLSIEDFRVFPFNNNGDFSI